MKEWKRLSKKGKAVLIALTLGGGERCAAHLL